MHRTLALALAAALFAPLSPAMADVHINSHCEIDSAYDISIESDRLVFSRTGSEVAFARGQLFVDGQAVVLSRADAERVAAFEREVRALIPEVRKIAADAVEVAFTALNQVIVTFASEENRASFKADLNAMRDEINSAVASANSSQILDDGAFEERIKGLVGRIAPRLAGEFAAQAVSAALSGDEDAGRAIEERAGRLEKEIEASVEAPARALEARVNALCPRIEELDRIENQLELRLPDGQPLNLIKVEAKA
jgi:hypothetical protein